jgi:thioredoxin-related protein
MKSLRLVGVLIVLSVTAPCLGDDLVKWRPIRMGEAEALKTGKPALYVMTAEWCGRCRTMKSEIFADPKLAEIINETFVPIQVVDRHREEGKNGEDEERIFTLYERRAFPTLTVARPGSTEAIQVVGWPGRKETAAFLESAKTRLGEMETKAAK